MANKAKTGLGKGLNSLLGGQIGQSQDIDQSRGFTKPSLTSIQEIELKNIVPNPLQPRVDFNPQKLKELADSISQIGVIQPITVVKLSVGKYQIISGERRYRASELAGKNTIPAYIKKDVEDSDHAKLELALVENIQREDLDPIEIALSLKRLIDEYNITQDSLSQRVSINRATIANYIRLLKLPPEVQLAIKGRRLSMGHAKALLSLNNDSAISKLAQRIIDEGLSVRAIEDIVKKANSTAQKSKTVARFKPSGYGVEVAGILEKYFSNKIKVKGTDKGGGSLIIRYNDEEELKSFLKKIKEHNL